MAQASALGSGRRTTGIGTIDTITHLTTGIIRTGTGVTGTGIGIEVAQECNSQKARPELTVLSNASPASRWQN